MPIIFGNYGKWQLMQAQKSQAGNGWWRNFQGFMINLLSFKWITWEQISSSSHNVHRIIPFEKMAVKKKVIISYLHPEWIQEDEKMIDFHCSIWKRILINNGQCDVRI